MVTFVPKFVLQAAVDWTAAADENMRAHGFHHLATTPEAMKVHRAFEERTRARSRRSRRSPTTWTTCARWPASTTSASAATTTARPSPPDGLDDVSGYPNLIAELLDRGWSEADLAKLTWRNAVRVLRATESVGRRLRAE